MERQKCERHLDKNIIIMESGDRFCTKCAHIIENSDKVRETYNS